MSKETQSEFELNEANFFRLYVKHEPTLRAYARSIVPDWNLVDEAMQEERRHVAKTQPTE